MTGARRRARRCCVAGADKVAVNRAAFDEPGILTALADEFGVAGRRLRDRRPRGRGRHARRSRAAGSDAVDWAREAVERGAGEILLTSIDADGTREGYDLPLTAAVADAVVPSR